MASLISGRLRGTFPLGLPECIRQTALPSVRGPDRARGCAAVLLVSNIMTYSFAAAPFMHITKGPPGGMGGPFIRPWRGGPGSIGRGNHKSGTVIPDADHYSKRVLIRQSLESKKMNRFNPACWDRKTSFWNNLA